MSKYQLWIQASLILALSVILKYQPPDFKDTNWDIALFLTPQGIINNYLKKDQTVMWSFYSDISPGQHQPNDIQILLAIAVYTLMICSAAYYFNSERLKK